MNRKNLQAHDVCVSVCVCYSFWVFAGVGLTSGSTRSTPDIAAPLRSSFPLLRLSANALLIRSERWNFYIGQTTDIYIYNLTGGTESMDYSVLNIWLKKKKKKRAPHVAIQQGCHGSLKAFRFWVSFNMCVCMRYTRTDNMQVHVCQGWIIKCSLCKMYNGI